MEIKVVQHMKPIVFLLSVAAISLVAAGLTDLAYAQEEGAGGMSDGSKLIGAGIAFGVAAGGAGVGLGQVGAAGLAVISENPALQSKVFIFVGMVESIAIYGIVMMFIILGQ
jgi:V/A-type H+-transporting ATPase subunit K